jgi:uncharacterized protein YbbC (DUF1343 family)/CubicO group peptidase (beta-lactamase class C family)
VVGLAARPVQPPRAATEARLARIEEIVTEAIAEGQLPGAVVLVGQRDRVLYRKAIGRRAIVPSPEPMTLDTIFDLASLTKVVATTTSVMILVEEGRIRLSDRVAAYVPEFDRYGKADITIRHLLTHTSGLRPDLDLGDLWQGAETAVALAVEEVPLAPPGARFIYSDINFFLLGDIVRRVSGRPLNEFARQRIFEPLGMDDTMFLPPAALWPRVAPTESCTPFGWPCEGPDARMLRGTVHDPTARRMGGVAGHAGLFSTADDLAVFCRMLLNGGQADGARVLAPLTVSRMTSPATGAVERNVRGFGWDIDSTFSSNRGELIPLGSFGHTGFTGTSLWIDPLTGLYVVFLSNRLHPEGKGDVTPLRARIATVAAAALTDVPADARRTAAWSRADVGPSGAVAAPRREPVLTGVDVLRLDGFARLRGRRIGLVTNHTGRARDGATTIDLLHAAGDVQLVALFSPEHGIRGVLDARVPSSRDEKTGLPVHSLYGDTRRPTSEMLDGLDVMVVDLQDVGARFYTYMTTMAYVMEEAARREIAVVVLDRPNPINGFQIEGPTLDRTALGFTGYYPMPIRHGLTLGELARLFNAENKIGADLTVVEMRHWRRDAWFDETALPWINPSPNMRNLNEATLYPGIGAIEGTNLSVGRGTDTPFEQVGAPWIDGVALAAALNARRLPGIRFYPVRFTPSSSKYAGEECQGVFMIVTDRAAIRPVRVGVEIAAALHRMYGRQFQVEAAERLFGSRDGLERLRAGEDPAAIAASWSAAEARWRLLRAKYLLYH